MTGHTRRNVLRGTAAIALAGGTMARGGGPAAATVPAASAAPGGSPFYEGVFAPVTEELTAFSLPVTGRIPRGLNGRYLRN
ncbi:dioxygenase, partial [Streptomyces violascens]